jgi:hypothetical protein
MSYLAKVEMSYSKTAIMLYLEGGHYGRKGHYHLDLSSRQVRRIAEKVKKEGDAGIIHKLRGRPSKRKTPDRIKDKVVNLCGKKYKGFGPLLASEKLFEIEQIKISDETLRNWLIEKGLWEKRRRRKKHRQWRERKHHFGEMLQMDGSHHNWFEDRGPESVLMGYIDDATNRVSARFYGYEGTLPAMGGFKGYVKRYGLPGSVYLDKHTTYKSPAKPTIEDELAGRESLSQFERALKELSVKVIHANSAQAKGRVERLFRTFQDRLIKEMRLKGIKTIVEANRFLRYYLPIYNKRFAFTPTKKADYHQPLPDHIDLDAILCIRTKHPLRNDFTIAHDKKLYQILDEVNTKKVTVEEKISGRMFITCRGKRLRYKQLSQRPRKEKPKPPYVFKIKKLYIPPKDHPWRRFKISSRIGNDQQKEKAGQKEKEEDLLLTKT